MHTELKYKVSVSNRNGTEEKSVKTPFNIDFSDIKQILIEKTDKGIKMLSVYPNGLIIYMENDPSQAFIRSNWPIEVANGELTVVQPSSEFRQQ